MVSKKRYTSLDEIAAQIPRLSVQTSETAR